MQSGPTAYLSPASLLRRSDRTAWQNFDEELVVLDVPSRTLLGLNKLGGWIWDRLDGTQSLEQIAQLLAQEYRQPFGTVQQDILSFAQSLLERGCLEPVEQVSGT